jgi:hypothetical protein
MSGGTGCVVVVTSEGVAIPVMVAAEGVSAIVDEAAMAVGFISAAVAAGDVGATSVAAAATFPTELSGVDATAVSAAACVVVAAAGFASALADGEVSAAPAAGDPSPVVVAAGVSVRCESVSVAD